MPHSPSAGTRWMERSKIGPMWSQSSGRVPKEKSRGMPSRFHTLPRGSKNPAMILPVSSLK